LLFFCGAPAGRGNLELKSWSRWPRRAGALAQGPSSAASSDRRVFDAAFRHALRRDREVNAGVRYHLDRSDGDTAGDREAAIATAMGRRD
jgi:hypothetical protein